MSEFLIRPQALSTNELSINGSAGLTGAAPVSLSSAEMHTYPVRARIVASDLASGVTGTTKVLHVDFLSNTINGGATGAVATLKDLQTGVLLGATGMYMTAEEILGKNDKIVDISGLVGNKLYARATGLTGSPAVSVELI